MKFYGLKSHPDLVEKIKKENEENKREFDEFELEHWYLEETKAEGAADLIEESKRLMKFYGLKSCAELVKKINKENKQSFNESNWKDWHRIMSVTLLFPSPVPKDKDDVEQAMSKEQLCLKRLEFADVAVNRYFNKDYRDDFRGILFGTEGYDVRGKYKAWDMIFSLWMLVDKKYGTQGEKQAEKVSKYKQIINIICTAEVCFSGIWSNIFLMIPTLIEEQVTRYELTGQLLIGLFVMRFRRTK